MTTTMGEPEGDRTERIRSEQEAAASEDLEAIRALAAAADSPAAETAEVAADQPEASAETKPDGTSTEPRDTGADSSGNLATGGGPVGTNTDKDTVDEDAAKSTSQQASAGSKRPPESGGAVNAEDEARHSHSHHHEWLAERHAHTRVGEDFQVAALPTPHPHHTSAGAGGTNESGGAKVADDPEKDTKG